MQVNVDTAFHVAPALGQSVFAHGSPQKVGRVVEVISFQPGYRWGLPSGQIRVRWATGSLSVCALLDLDDFQALTDGLFSKLNGYIAVRARAENLQP